MAYDSGASFRRALEDRLRSQSLQTGVPLVLRLFTWTSDGVIHLWKNTETTLLDQQTFVSNPS
jgi:hypothetical protein